MGRFLLDGEDKALFALGVDLLLFVFVHFLDGWILIGFAGALGSRCRRCRAGFGRLLSRRLGWTRGGGVGRCISLCRGTLHAKRMAPDSSIAASATGFSVSGWWFIDPAPVRSMKTAALG